MIIAVDTNILVRSVSLDHPVETPLAQDILRKAEAIVVSNSTLCEFVWVLKSAYKMKSGDIATVLETMMRNSAFHIDHAVVLAGLDVLKAKGDFADGVIAAEGKRMGASTFWTFDRSAAKALGSLGYTVAIPDA